MKNSVSFDYGAGMRYLPIPSPKWEVKNVRISCRPMKLSRCAQIHLLEADTDMYVDKVRIMKPLRTQTKGTKPIVFGGGKKLNELSIYTFLRDVEYQVQAHFEWNEHRPELADDRIDGKHFSILKRILEKGGRQDIFLGTRDCQGYRALRVW